MDLMIGGPRFPHPDNEKDQRCLKCKRQLGVDIVIAFKAVPGPLYERPKDHMLLMSSQTQFFCLECYQEFVRS